MELKKSLGFFVLFMIALSGFAAAADFREANASYQAGNFTSAVKSYRELARSGQGTADVYYNLGNACFKIGQKGQALLAYERALKAAPRDKDIRWNIQVLKSVLPDRLDGNADLVSMTLQAGLGNISAGEAALALFAAFAVLFILSLLQLFLQSPPAVKSLKAFVWLLVILSGVIAFLKWIDIKDPRVVILTKEVSAHYGPTNQETQAFLLHEGAEAKVIDESGEWYYVQLENKNTGWILKKTCEVI